MNSRVQILEGRRERGRGSKLSRADFSVTFSGLLFRNKVTGLVRVGVPVFSGILSRAE